MLATILSFVGSLLGGPFVTGALNAYKAKLTAENSADKIAADLAVQQAQIDEQRAGLAKQVIVAEQGRWWTAIIRPLFAAPFIIFFWKVIVWDTVLGRGHTDPLTPEMYWVMSAIITAYFVSASMDSFSRVLSRKK